jgi:hypothetical protein
MCEIMCEMGNPDQWKDGYTERVQIEHDIEAGVLYVCEDSEQYFAGCLVLTQGPDQSYTTIYQGE